MEGRKVIRFSCLSRWFSICLAGLVTLELPVSAEARDTTIRGTIVSYECGDNCYLTIVDREGTEHTGLCAAPECEDWNADAAMPPDFVGRRVRATVGEGVQYDADGNAMGQMMEFRRIRFRD